MSKKKALTKTDNNRTVILYRCSTDRQDLKDQQETCRRFCANKNFKIIDEIEEEDVSGYKLALAQRIGLLEVLTKAEEGLFDNLVVFMFDRLGRREDETPFIIQKLHDCGIKIFIAKSETEIEADTMENKLMNYFQSWVAQYESVKTSIRVKSKMAYLNDQGEYTGGTPPFGYEVYALNIFNNKGKQKHDIRINKEEADIIKLIFDLCIKHNYGAGRIASYLNTNKYKNRTDYKINENKERTPTICPFRSNSINRILRNPIYIGLQRWNCHNSTQNGIISNSKDEWKFKPKRDDLVIINDETFFKANQLIDLRKVNKKFNFEDGEENNQGKVVPTKSQLLCTGLAYCQCGGKLKADYSVKKYTRKTDGKVTVMKTLRYSCINSKNEKDSHVGINKYSGKKYDTYVTQAVYKILDSIDMKEANIQIEQYKTDNIKKLEIEQKNLNSEKEQCYHLVLSYQKKMDDLTLQDESDEKEYKFKILFQAMKRNENNIEEINKKLQDIVSQLNSSKSELVDMNKFIENCIDMRKNWDKISLDEKKAALYNFVSRIIFYNNEVQLVVKMPVYESLTPIKDNEEDGAISTTKPSPSVIEIQDKDNINYLNLFNKYKFKYSEIILSQKIA